MGPLASLGLASFAGGPLGILRLPLSLQYSLVGVRPVLRHLWPFTPVPLCLGPTAQQREPAHLLRLHPRMGLELSNRDSTKRYNVLPVIVVFSGVDIFRLLI